MACSGDFCPSVTLCVQRAGVLLVLNRGLFVVLGLACYFVIISHLHKLLK